MVNEGTYSTAKSYKKISTEEQKQISEVLANSEWIYIETGKVFAKGYTVIETKNRLPKNYSIRDVQILLCNGLDEYTT